MAYYEYTGGGYAGNYGGRGGTNYGGNYRGGNYQSSNYRGGNYQSSNYRGGNYQSGGAGNYQQQQTNYAPASRGNYGGYGAGYGSLGQLASMARAGYGAPGAYGRGGPGGGYQGGGYGMGPASGAATGYGPPPSRIGSTYGAPAIQSQRQLNAPGPISAGANYNQPDPQANAPGGELSGQPPSMMDRLMSVLGGVSPVSSAQAAEAPPQTGPQDTLTPEDIQASPFKGPWTGTDTGQGRQLGAPYGTRGLDISTEGQPNTNWAGYDPQAGGEAAPMGGAPPAMGTGTGWFSTAGNPLGGEAAPMGGAPPPGGGAPASAGWFSTADNPLGGEAAPMGGEIPPWNWYSRPDNFATRFDAAPPGQAVPADRVSAADQLAFSGQTAETPGDAALRDRLAGLTGSYPAPSGWGPDPSAKADQLRTIPTTDQSTQLALQGVDATPPGGSLTGGGTGFDPGAFTGSTPGSFAQIPSGGQFDPNAFVGTNPPGPFQRGAATFGDDPTRFQPGVPGTVAGTETPPAPGSPADIAARGWQDAAPPGGAPPPTPEAGVGGEAAPPGGASPPTQVAGGEAAPPGGAIPPAQAAGGETAPTPQASSTAVGISSTGGAAGAQDARGQGVGRETDPQYNPPPNSLAGVISNMFGGGDLGNTVSKLMLQLGIPAALIFAATRGRGGNLGLVGGQGAMSGAGRGVFGPQFASAPLFPGPGLPALAGLGLTGALVGNKLANPPQPGSVGSDHPPTAPATPAAREDPGTSLTVPPGANMPMPVPHRTPLQTAQAGAQGGAVGYIQQRGGHPAGQGAPDLNPEFASRVQRAAQAYKAETGREAQFGEMGRSRELQSQYYADFRRTGQGRAAPPGSSRHEKGMAIDIPDGDFQNWMHRNARRFGLEGLRPELNDPNHFQMASL